MASIEKRTAKSGDISYRVKVRLRGYPQQIATFERLTDAKLWAKKVEMDLLEGRHFKYSEAKKHTLREMINRYIAEVLPRKTDNIQVIKQQTTQLNWWANEYGDYLLVDITPQKIAEGRDKLFTQQTHYGKPMSSSTVVRYMAALSHALSVAVREWEWLETSPMSKVTKPREPRGRVRFLSDKERKNLLVACNDSEHPMLYTIVVLALSTGMRHGEIMSLKWQDVNLPDQYLILHETKNGERRRVPLAGHALALLKQHHKARDAGSDWVFPSLRPSEAGRHTSIRKAWGTALVAAKINDFRFHDLRHSAASYLAMNGASLAEIAEVLGHKTLQMVKRYAHLSEAHTSKVVASMNERIFG